jgi:catechol 2,3-dioxygenase-like lactoylglutathione lyase family enzyme
MFDHLSLGVRDLAASIAFYDAALAPLGFVRLWTKERGAGYGPAGAKDEPFAIVKNAGAAPSPAFHLAFAATSREAVDGFHGAALAAGGVDDGGPGIRDRYDPGYYAAFVRDLDGHRLEAVLHE